MRELASLGWYVKICGVTTVDDAMCVADSGATALGAILTESTRRIGVARAAEIAAATQGRILRIAVVRGDEETLVRGALERIDFDAVQVHGPLGDELRDWLRERHVAVIKALSVETPEFHSYDDREADAVLVEGPIPGSGEPHAWDSLARRGFTGRVIGAGGLTSSSVGAVIDAYNLWGVDVSTGVESSPGVKDHRRVLDFVATARRHLEGRMERSG